MSADPRGVAKGGMVSSTRVEGTGWTLIESATLEFTNQDEIFVFQMDKARKILQTEDAYLAKA